MKIKQNIAMIEITINTHKGGFVALYSSIQEVKDLLFKHPRFVSCKDWFSVSESTENRFDIQTGIYTKTVGGFNDLKNLYVNFDDLQRLEIMARKIEYTTEKEIVHPEVKMPGALYEEGWIEVIDQGNYTRNDVVLQRISWRVVKVNETV